MKHKNKVFYVLLEGGVESHENMFDTIKREIKEVQTKKLGRRVEFYFYVSKYKGNLKTGFDPEDKELVVEKVCFHNYNEFKNLIFHPRELINI